MKSKNNAKKTSNLKKLQPSLKRRNLNNKEKEKKKERSKNV